MTQIENIQSVKINIQATGFKMNEYLTRKIYNMVNKLKIILPGVNWIDIYLKHTNEIARPRTVVVRFGKPGPDLVASDSGHRWKILLKNVEKRLIRKLEKRKAISLS